MRTFEITKDIEVNTYTGEDQCQKEEFSAGETFNEDNILSVDELRYEVQWGNGDVSFIPAEFVREI